MQDLGKLLERLLANQIDFVLVGGFAAVVHGSTLVTQDLDICSAITDESLAKLRTALRDLHPCHRMNPNFKPSFLDHPERAQGTKNIYLETDLGILDIISDLPPAGDFVAIKAHSIEIDLYGRKCRVISLENLIQIKASMKRPKDQQALEELQMIQQKRSRP